jgi:hypothetical protein
MRYTKAARSLCVAVALALAWMPAPVQAAPVPHYALAAYSAAAGLAAAPPPERVGNPPIPWVASLVTADLGYIPGVVLLTYAYAGDLDRGWQVARTQLIATGAGASLGLLIAALFVNHRPYPDGNEILWVLAPLLGAGLGDMGVAFWAAFDVYGVAESHGKPTN